MGVKKKLRFDVNGTRIYLERMGSGEPILMIPGVGAGGWLWNPMAPALSNHFDLIMPHLRGSGLSHKPDQTYTVGQFSKDMKGVVDGLGLQKIHIVGVSLGGYIAQEFAKEFPEMVETLSLIATASGSDDCRGPDGQTLSQMIRLRGKTRKARLEEAYQMNFSESFITDNQSELDEITRWRIQYPQPEFAYYRQLMAGLSFRSNGSIKKMNIPTFIAGGTEDKMVPITDVKLLQRQIKNAILKVYEGKHLFFFENKDQFNKDILSFLQSHPLKESN